MSTTARLGVTKLVVAQEHKEVAINSALDVIDAAVTKVTGDTMTGALTIARTAVTSGSPTGSLIVTAAADTGMTAGTESPSVHLNLSATRQFATGALAHQRAIKIQAPTYGFVGASTVAIASTLAISGAPIAGTNATLTAAYALEVESGASLFGGAVAVSGALTAAGVVSTAANTTTITDTSTNAVVTCLTMTHALSSGTAAAGHGTAFVMQAMNSSNAQFTAGKFNAFTTVSTPGNEGSALSFKIFYTGLLCEVARLRAVGMAVAGGVGGEFTVLGDLGHQGTNVGFYNTTPIARPAAYTLLGTATRTFPTDPSSAYTGIDNAQAGTVYAQLTNLNTLRAAVSSLQGVVRQIVQDLGKTNGVGLNNT